MKPAVPRPADDSLAAYYRSSRSSKARGRAPIPGRGTGWNHQSPAATPWSSVRASGFAPSVGPNDPRRFRPRPPRVIRIWSRRRNSKTRPASAEAESSLRTQNPIRPGGGRTYFPGGSLYSSAGWRGWGNPFTRSAEARPEMTPSQLNLLPAVASRTSTLRQLGGALRGVHQRPLRPQPRGASLSYLLRGTTLTPGGRAVS